MEGDHLNPGGRGCTDHCTPAWATKVKLHLKKKKNRQTSGAQTQRALNALPSEVGFALCIESCSVQSLYQLMRKWYNCILEIGNSSHWGDGDEVLDLWQGL